MVIIDEPIDRHVGGKSLDSILLELRVSPAERTHHVVSVQVGSVVPLETLPAEGVSTGQKSSVFKDIQTQRADQTLGRARGFFFFLCSHVNLQPNDANGTVSKIKSFAECHYLILINAIYKYF